MTGLRFAASEAVSDGERPTPIVLCGDRLYLNRMWRNELTVARFFNEANVLWTLMRPCWRKRWTLFPRQR